MEYPLLQRLFLWPLSSGTLLRVVFFSFFHPLCPFCLFLSAQVFGLCVSFTHTHHKLPISCYLRTLRWICFYVFRVSLVRETFPPVLHLFPFLLEFRFPPRSRRESGGLSDFFCCCCLLILSTTAVRGVQGAAGELCPSGGCSFADRETMEETGGGRGGQRSQRAGQAPPSPRDPRLASHPWLLQQEVPSLLKMPR